MSTSSPIGLPGLHSPNAGFDQPFEMLDACHDRVRRSLGLLQRLLDHVDAHGADADARAAAGDVWRYFDMAAPHHHQDEERHVVPRLLASGDARLVAAAQQMLDDHQAFQSLWSRLGPALAALRDGALPDRAGLRADAEAFVARHDSHVPLEDGLAFPAARAGLSPEALAAMGAEMAARRRPGG